MKGNEYYSCMLRMYLCMYDLLCYNISTIVEIGQASMHNLIFKNHNKNMMINISFCYYSLN